jgi:hypothetical protein
MNPAARLLVLPALGLLALTGVAGCGGDASARAARATTTPLVAAPPSGLVHGRLIEVGGPPPGTAHPIPGSLTFTGPDGSVTTTHVGASGKYAIGLSPGTYQITGGGTQVISGKGDCTTTNPTTVITAGGDVTADVYCQVR